MPRESIKQLVRTRPFQACAGHCTSRVWRIERLSRLIWLRVEEINGLIQGASGIALLKLKSSGWIEAKNERSPPADHRFELPIGAGTGFARQKRKWQPPLQRKRPLLAV